MNQESSSVYLRLEGYDLNSQELDKVIEAINQDGGSDDE
jgi:hypothetical protein